MASKRNKIPLRNRGKANVVLWMFVPGAPNRLSLRTVSASGCGENKSRTDFGGRKNMAERKAVSTPARDPNVPGVFRMQPSPDTVAIIKASRGFGGGTNAAAALRFAVIR